MRAAALALVAATGCATLLGNTPQVPVATNPPGASIYLNGQLVGQSPMYVRLDEDRERAVIQIDLPGYQSLVFARDKHVQGWFFGNIMFWPGFFVDLISGDYQTFDDSGIAIGLTPVR